MCFYGDGIAAMGTGSSSSIAILGPKSIRNIESGSIVTGIASVVKVGALI